MECDVEYELTCQRPLGLQDRGIWQPPNTGLPYRTRAGYLLGGIYHENLSGHEFFVRDEDENGAVTCLDVHVDDDGTRVVLPIPRISTVAKSATAMLVAHVNNPVTLLY